MIKNNKLQKIFEESEKKAAELGDDEINARLGPATRTFFNIAETIEYKLKTMLSGTFHNILILWTGWIAGSLVGTYLVPHLTTQKIALTTILALSTIGLFTGVKSTKNQKQIIFYLAWIFFILNTLRKSNGNIEPLPIIATGIFAYVIGWLGTKIMNKYKKIHNPLKPLKDKTYHQN